MLKQMHSFIIHGRAVKIEVNCRTQFSRLVIRGLGLPCLYFGLGEYFKMLHRFQDFLKNCCQITKTELENNVLYYITAHPQVPTKYALHQSTQIGGKWA